MSESGAITSKGLSVCTPEETVEFARLLGALASADRPIKMFPGLRQAHTWLDNQRR